MYIFVTARDQQVNFVKTQHQQSCQRFTRVARRVARAARTCCTCRLSKGGQLFAKRPTRYIGNGQLVDELAQVEISGSPGLEKRLEFGNKSFFPFLSAII